MNPQLLSAIALAALHCSAIAQPQPNWEQFSFSRAGGSGYTDYGRITRDNLGVSTFRAWWKADLLIQEAVNGKSYKSTLSLYRVDCAEGSLTKIARHFYDGNDRLVYSDEFPALPSIAIPGSTGEKFISTVCGAAKQRNL